MKRLAQAVARIALEVHPDQIEILCGELEENKDTAPLPVVKGTLGSVFSPELLKEFSGALAASPNISHGELCAMFRASYVTAAIGVVSSSVELVWTGPATGMVPLRHTAQVLTGLIDEAHDRLFLVSFVAYHVDSVIDALRRAIERRVQVSILLEQSKEHGGNVTVDSLAMLKRSLPNAQLYIWVKTTPDGGLGGSVHAKCAVADGVTAFITSANLSDAAMERNMELGVLLRGGQVPDLLDRHLTALVTTKQLHAL